MMHPLRTATLLFATFSYLPAVHAETAAEFLARAVCETAANKEAVDEKLREFVIKACTGGEMARSLEYKKSLVPAPIYSRCTARSNSLAESHDCIDRAAWAAGTWRSFWQLQSGGGTWVFWTAEDCNTARIAFGGGVCVGS